MATKDLIPVGYRVNGAPWLDATIFGVMLAGIFTTILIDQGWAAGLFIAPYLIFAMTRRQSTYHYSRIEDHTQTGKNWAAAVLGVITALALFYVILTDHVFSIVPALAVGVLAFVDGLVGMKLLTPYITAKPLYRESAGQ